MRTLIVHNPKSGFGSDAIFQFERALVRGGDECVLRILADDFQARDVSADCGEYDVVVVSGGDGTVASFLYALRGTGTPVCVFPSGTANLLAANIGNAPDTASLAKACREGRTARADMGELAWRDAGGEERRHTFLIIAGKARFEAYGADRIGCFWIGG